MLGIWNDEQAFGEWWVLRKEEEMEDDRCQMEDMTMTKVPIPKTVCRWGQEEEQNECDGQKGEGC